MVTYALRIIFQLRTCNFPHKIKNISGSYSYTQVIKKRVYSKDLVASKMNMVFGKG